MAMMKPETTFKEGDRVRDKFKTPRLGETEACVVGTVGHVGHLVHVKMDDGKERALPIDTFKALFERIVK